MKILPNGRQLKSIQKRLNIFYYFDNNKGEFNMKNKTNKKGGDKLWQ